MFTSNRICIFNLLQKHESKYMENILEEIYQKIMHPLTYVFKTPVKESENEE